MQKLKLKLTSPDVRLLDAAVKTVLNAVSAKAKGVIAMPLPSREGVSKRIIEINGVTVEIIDILTKLYITKAVYIEFQ
jgi:ribosomal protein S10